MYVFIVYNLMQQGDFFNITSSKYHVGYNKNTHTTHLIAKKQEYLKSKVDN